MTVNSEDDFIKKVERAYQGEVYGEALYSGIASAMDDPARAEKWRVLTELEVVTKARMRDLVAKLGGDPRESDVFRQKGVDHVQKYARMPWTDFMKVFSRELDPIIERYAALEERCAPDDVETLRFLTEHEVVTKAFCDLELAGRSDISIEPTRELIAKMRTA
ncbi:hypothetical protein [Hyphomicrobium facile]|uniref:DUF2383 domain-containing protein n=1 Tax=Hyphomicrobium facile TaxID=51670 RepID=A0A1I7NBR4_9HYPH|nr:hypothetical protein [Hyphomicrobium facile]SFV32112.1 hypothetical protein SAMN04488557_1488 [Hyphomicrobium facile]